MRTLLIAFTTVAITLSGVHPLGPATTAVFVSSLALLTWSVLSWGQGWWWLARSIGVVCGALLFWLSAVDGRWTYPCCPDCGWGLDCLEYRIVGIPVYRECEDRSHVASYVLRDLGSDCRHPQRTVWVKHRYRGGILCGWPCINGSLGVVDDRYIDPVAARVRKVPEAQRVALAARIQETFFRDDDSGLFYDGLFVDWWTLAGFDVGRAREAREWIATTEASLRRRVETGICDCGSTYPPDWRSDVFEDYVERVYETEIDQVIVVWQPDESSRSEADAVWGRVVVRLPTAVETRRTVFAKINARRAAAGERPYLDYRQQFAYASELVGP